MAYSLDILNTIRMNSTDYYMERIPEATVMNLLQVGFALQTYTPAYNEFCESLIHKIGKTIIEQKMFKNKLSRFKSGSVNTQQDVEEIFIEMAKSEGSYDKDGKNPLGRRTLPDVKVLYHRMNRQDYYAISIGDIDFARVFRSPETLDTFILGLINSVYSADEYDEWLMMKTLIGQNVDNMFTYSVAKFSNATDKNKWCKDFVKTVKKAAMDISFASTEYNKAGVMTWTNPKDMVLLVNKDVLSEVDVELLAQAFHMDKTDINPIGNIIPYDDMINFDADDVMAVLVDKNWFRIYDTLSKMETQRNAQGLFTNYFYHHHQILSVSTFKNAVKFASIGTA